MKKLTEISPIFTWKSTAFEHIRVFGRLIHDLTKNFVHFIETLGLYRKLGSDVTTYEDTLKIHPPSLQL